MLKLLRRLLRTDHPVETPSDPLDEFFRMRPLDLHGANIHGTSLTHTDLRDANFVGADCSGVDFTGADMKGAKLDGTILIGAILRDVANLTWEQLDRAIIDETTVLPDYLRYRRARVPAQ